MSKTNSTHTNNPNDYCGCTSIRVSNDSVRTLNLKNHPHYDNKNGSLYKIASDLNLNAYEFDILKRIARCRKKGQFEQDLQKIKDTVDLYLKEHKQ